MEASPTVENSTREAAPACEPVERASLMGWEMLGASLENTHELPIAINGIPSIRATPTTAEQLALPSDLEMTTRPEATSHSAIGQELVPTRAEDMSTELTRSSVETGPISNFDILASQAILAPSVDPHDSPLKIWEGENARGRAAGESPATTVKRRNGNTGQGQQRKSIVP